MTTDPSTITKILSEAYAALEAADLPDDLRPVAYGKAIDMLSGTGRVRRTATVEETDPHDERATGAQIDKIAKRLGTDRNTAEYFFDADEDDVTLVVPRSKLDSNKSTATQQVALLYAAARQAGGYDDSHTGVTSIRSKVENMGVLDAGNFSTYLKNIEGLSMRGSGQSREFKVTSHGYEVAAKIIERIRGGARP